MSIATSTNSKDIQLLRRRRAKFKTKLKRRATRCDVHSLKPTIDTKRLLARSSLLHRVFSTTSPFRFFAVILRLWYRALGFLHVLCLSKFWFQKIWSFLICQMQLQWVYILLNGRPFSTIALNGLACLAAISWNDSRSHLFWNDPLQTMKRKSACERMIGERASHDLFWSIHEKWMRVLRWAHVHCI